MWRAHPVEEFEVSARITPVGVIPEKDAPQPLPIGFSSLRPMSPSGGRTGRGTRVPAPPSSSPRFRRINSTNAPTVPVSSGVAPASAPSPNSLSPPRTQSHALQAHPSPDPSHIPKNHFTENHTGMSTPPSPTASAAAAFPAMHTPRTSPENTAYAEMQSRSAMSPPSIFHSSPP
jgi:hypothetical protein